MLSKFVVTALISGLSSFLILQPTWAQSNAARADDVVVEMNQAFKRGDRNRLSALLPQVRGHALEPWAAYWELKARLDEASAREVQDFMVRYAGTYQEDRLRNDWLLLLGQRRDWAGFAAEYPRYRMGDDRDVRCYALLVEHLKNPGVDAQLAEEVRRNWFAQRDASDGCTSAASRLIGNRNLTTQDAWIKARLATEANRPRAAREAVEIIEPEAVGLVTELTASPARFLTTKVIAISRVRKEIIVLALVKLASSDAEGAARFMQDKWGMQLNEEERNWVWGSIGRQAATRLASEDSVGYFARVSRNTDLSDDMLGWKVRAALRAGGPQRWSQVLAGINAMSEGARKEPVWAYWKARALLSNAPPLAPGAMPSPQRAEALALLQSIASVRGFYEQLALEELGQKITLPARPPALTAEEKEAARLNPGLNRGAYAIALGLRTEGVREWNYSTNLHTRGGMSERELLAAAQFACDRAIWDRCINTSERTVSAFDAEQRFPMPFRDAVTQRSREIGLDPAYVYGLIRQESRFIMDARSHVGASGLMQVMPATARETARYIGLTGFTPDQINDRDTNIVIGTAYLKRALDDFGGSMPLAAAAYNAGPGRPRAWRNGPVIEAAIWAENVPFSETRDYVKKVLSNTTNYAALLSGQPQSLKARLGTVGPREASAPPPDEKMP
ncbi:MAG: lytic transglycosylase domain-containing protein [Pseudomonadota bacterium]|uniref:lytic transglycosylase domain-containing protein n=1 Tax=Polaromonas sp. TaxID=1869339 RepID=UPI0017DAB946|nr:lytic transglycosylase domain-containing protein [Polaromonas sp.]MBA3594965.1 lytic transglycosylase domain-containing protein [Polaromonas sp.]MDQ3271806.1 lytic transglycosylase domain-containing protein [Pseudomonadota bacterium]